MMSLIISEREDLEDAQRGIEHDPHPSQRVQINGLFAFKRRRAVKAADLAVEIPKEPIAGRCSAPACRPRPSGRGLRRRSTP